MQAKVENRSATIWEQENIHVSYRQLNVNEVVWFLLGALFRFIREVQI
jgi:hypothetical protein